MRNPDQKMIGVKDLEVSEARVESSRSYSWMKKLHPTREIDLDKGVVEKKKDEDE